MLAMARSARRVVCPPQLRGGNTRWLREKCELEMGSHSYASAFGTGANMPHHAPLRRFGNRVRGRFGPLGTADLQSPNRELEHSARLPLASRARSERLLAVPDARSVRLLAVSGCSRPPLTKIKVGYAILTSMFSKELDYLMPDFNL